MHRQLFPQPSDGWVGDVIPWQEDGVLWLFYLHDQRGELNAGMPWRVLRTKDLLTSTRPASRSQPAPTTPQTSTSTPGASSSMANGVHHLFYTGQNPRIVGEDGLPAASW